MKMPIILTVLLIGATIGNAQDAARRKNATINPCPGGTATVELDVIPVPSLERLVQVSQLIVRGTVLSVLPAFNTGPDDVVSIETDSLIAVNGVLSGSLPAGIQAISLFQNGGKAGPCAEVVPDDPLVQAGEQYVLFLSPDDRKVPNTSGAPRYDAIGVWSGKAKIVNGKIQFLPRVHPEIRKYDNTDVSAFIAILKDRISILKKKQP